MRHVSSVVRFHWHSILCLKIFPKSQLGFLSDIPEEEDFVSIQIMVPRPRGSWSYETPSVLRSLRQAADRLDAAAHPLGWHFTMPARRDEVAAIDDEKLRQAYEELYRHIDSDSSDWHNMLHDAGARCRRDMYAAMRPMAFMLGRRIVSSE